MGGWGCGSRTIEWLKWRKSAGWGVGEDRDWGCVAIGVNAVQTPPSGVWLAGLEVGLEQAGEGCLGEEGFGWGPELDLGTGEDDAT